MSTNRLIRRPRQAAINFNLNLVAPLSENMAEVGLDAPSLAAFTLAVTNANDANLVVDSARQAYKAAVAAADERWREMNSVSAATVARIDAFAEASDDPTKVWSLATLQPPSNPSSLPAPGAPSNFRASLPDGGGIRIAWDCKNPQGAQGTVYIVRRRLLNAGPNAWTQLAITGSKFWTDTTLPATAGGAAYQVIGQRGNLVGEPSTPFTVQFGIDGGGMVIASQFTGETKMAA
jgi:hypothetical protein